MKLIEKIKKINYNRKFYNEKIHCKILLIKGQYKESFVKYDSRRNIQDYLFLMTLKGYRVEMKVF